jgi:hypothetical protein
MLDKSNSGSIRLDESKITTQTDQQIAEAQNNRLKIAVESNLNLAQHSTLSCERYVVQSGGVTVIGAGSILSSLRGEVHPGGAIVCNGELILADAGANLSESTLNTYKNGQNSEAQLRELEVRLSPENPRPTKKGTNTRDLLNTLNHGQPRLNQNRYPEETSDQSSNNPQEKIEKSEKADFIIEEDNPAEELLQYASALNFK